MYPPPRKILWDNLSSVKFISALESELVQRESNDFINSNHGESDLAALQFQNIMHMAAKIGLKFNKPNKNNKPKHKKWFDQTLQHMRRDLDSLSALLSRFPRDPVIRGNLTVKLRIYNMERKKKSREYRNNILDKLAKMKESNPQAYWNLLEQLKDDKDVPRAESIIQNGQWYEHFSQLNSMSAHAAERHSHYTYNTIYSTSIAPVSSA